MGISLCDDRAFQNSLNFVSNLSRSRDIAFLKLTQISIFVDFRGNDMRNVKNHTLLKSRIKYPRILPQKLTNPLFDTTCFDNHKL